MHTDNTLFLDMPMPMPMSLFAVASTGFQVHGWYFLALSFSAITKRASMHEQACMSKRRQASKCGARIILALWVFLRVNIF